MSIAPAHVVIVEDDLVTRVKLAAYFTAAGYQVKRPLYCGDAEAIRKHHQEFLAKCELLIVFYGHGDEIWKESVESDLRKAVAYRNGNPLPKQATYIAEPSRPDKQDLIDWGVPGIIDGLGEFPQASLAELLK